MTFFSDDQSLFSRLTVAEHLCGWNNLVHGGILSTILDEIMSWSAIYLLKRIILTKSMCIEFKKPVFTDTEILAEGRVLEVTGKREALMEGMIYDQQGRLCATSTGRLALFTPEAIKRMKIMDEAAIKDLEPLLGS